MSETKMIHMDLTIAQCLIKEGRALVPAANKSDLSGAGGDSSCIAFKMSCRKCLHKYAVPVVPISAR